MTLRPILLALTPVLAAAPVLAQASDAVPPDLASPEAVVAASYEALSRAPGEPFDWARYRTLFLDEAVLVPATEQTGGTFRPMSVEEFIAWVDGWYRENAPIGAPGDRGFAEEQVAHRIERYGDVAQVFSTYRKRYWDAPDELGRGINAIQLVRRDGRWRMVSVAWDEEIGAGPLPARYAESPPR